jgi:type II secretory pathway component PulF
MNKLILQSQLFDELSFLLKHLPGQLPQQLRTPLGKKLAVPLKRGLSLAESYRCAGGDMLIAGLLQAGQNDLQLVVPEVSRYYALLVGLHKGLRKQLVYPLITLFVAILVLTGFFIFVYPLLQAMLPERVQGFSWSFWLIILSGMFFSAVYYQQLRRAFLDWTKVPQLLRKLQIVLLLQLAPDTPLLVKMLQQYASDGSLAKTCFQLQKGGSLVRVLQEIGFTAQELLLIEQVEISGDKNIYQEVVLLIRAALESRVQFLTQLIEPVVTLLTGGLVAICVYTMLWPVLQLQQGISV